MEIAGQVGILPHMRKKEGCAWGGDGKTPPRGMGGVSRALGEPVVSRKKRGFSAHSGPGGVVLPPRVLSFKDNALSMLLDIFRKRRRRLSAAWAVRDADSGVSAIGTLMRRGDRRFSALRGPGEKRLPFGERHLMSSAATWRPSSEDRHC